MPPPARGEGGRLAAVVAAPDPLPLPPFPQAHLRLSGVGFEVQEQADSGTSPSGQLPALELQGEVAPGTGAGDIVRRLDGAALGGALGALDLDARLSPEQQADLAAFQALVGVSLAEATLWITWGDAEAYTRYTRAAYSSRLPAPLSYLVPRGQRKQVLRNLEQRGSGSAAGALRLAARAYRALDAKLAAGGGARYFFGDRPSSLDAAVLAHVLFHRTAPVSPQPLREELGKHPHLVKYCDRLAAEVFNAPRAKPLPIGEGVRPEAGASSGGRARGGGGAGQATAKENPEYVRQRRIWLAMAFTVVVGYVLLGDVIDIEFLDSLEAELDGGGGDVDE